MIISMHIVVIIVDHIVTQHHGRLYSYRNIIVNEIVIITSYNITRKDNVKHDILTHIPNIT